jgi:hypothetical protein
MVKIKLSSAIYQGLLIHQLNLILTTNSEDSVKITES